MLRVIFGIFIMLCSLVLIIALGILSFKFNNEPLPDDLGDCRYFLTGWQLQECVDMYRADKQNEVFNSLNK